MCTDDLEDWECEEEEEILINDLHYDDPRYVPCPYCRLPCKDGRCLICFSSLNEQEKEEY